ncbi:MAG: S-layer homology domain-containing protein [Thermoleophilia bacterium]
MSRRKRTIFIASLAVGVFLLAAAVAYAAGMFPDVASTDTHFDAIEWAAENEIVNGYTNGNFGPYDNIKRGQAATMFKNYDDYLQSTMNGSSSCADCHNASTLITGKVFAWEGSVHGSGTAADYAGGRSGCSGCHSGAAFSEMVAAGQNPGAYKGTPEITRQDCRACHEVHETYTGADWALETTAAVALYAVPGSTYDGGMGNLCVNCHQPRRVFPEANAAGMITGITSHWGPHHGPQSSMLLGKAGAGVDGNPSGHYNLVADTCVGCHANNDQHTFEPDVAVCKTCHPSAEDFDVNGLQTDVQERLDAIGTALVAEGVLSDITADGHPIVEEAPEDIAIALYNWIYIAHEDKSLGVHNPTYTKAMLTAAEDALGL